MSIDHKHSRKIASMLADTLAPLVAEHITAQPPLPPRKVLVEADRRLVAAAERVATAYDRLQQARYTPAETSARMSLERSASDLTSAFKRTKRHGK